MTGSMILLYQSLTSWLGDVMFDEILPGKTALFIPVYSMRSHVTGKYNLRTDGNFNRVMAVIRKYKPRIAVVTIPEYDRLSESINVDEFSIPGVRLVFRYSSIYGENANATRKASYSDSAFSDPYSFDAVISEPQHVTLGMMNSEDKINLYYWCVATSTDDWPVWFVDEFKELDVLIANNVPTIVATEAQKKKLGDNAVVGDFYISQPKKKIMYFPFRASDSNYQFEMFKLLINHIRARGYADKFTVLLADVNESTNELPSYFKLVPSHHDVYQAILNGKPIIPYFEHMDRLPHISIYEMIEAGCSIVTWDCEDARKYDTITTVNSYKEFEDALVKLIEED